MLINKNYKWFISLPSSISGGRPPTKTLRENRSLGSVLDMGNSLNNDSVSFPVKNGDFPNEKTRMKNNPFE